MVSMSEKSSSLPGGISGCLLCIFVTLKLLGKIDWSWWWVCSPIWIPLLIVVFILALILIAAVVKSFFD
jgi:hypothetical protein